METQALESVDITKIAIEATQPELHGGARTESPRLGALEQKDLEAVGSLAKMFRIPRMVESLKPSLFPELEAPIVKKIHRRINRRPRELSGPETIHARWRDPETKR